MFCELRYQNIAQLSTFLSDSKKDDNDIIKQYMRPNLTLTEDQQVAIDLLNTQIDYSQKKVTIPISAM